MRPSANFIRIDEILSLSLIKWVGWGGCLLVILVIIGLLNLPLNYRVLIGFLAMICIGLNHIIRPQLVAISTIAVHPLAIIENLKRADITLTEPLQLNNIQWQLAIKIDGFTHTTSQLWQGYLLTASDTGKMLILNFCIIEPQVQQIKLTLWQDQCMPDTWRQLKAISHLVKE